MELLKKRLANLFCIKSIITIMLTAVFSYMTVTGHVSADQLSSVVLMVVSFYFGTQSAKDGTTGTV